MYNSATNNNSSKKNCIEHNVLMNALICIYQYVGIKQRTVEKNTGIIYILLLEGQKIKRELYTLEN